MRLFVVMVHLNSEFLGRGVHVETALEVVAMVAAGTRARIAPLLLKDWTLINRVAVAAGWGLQYARACAQATVACFTAGRPGGPFRRDAVSAMIISALVIAHVTVFALITCSAFPRARCRELPPLTH